MTDEVARPRAARQLRADAGDQHGRGTGERRWSTSTRATSAASSTRGRLDRALEFLPDDETLTERKAAEHGLTAPEFAILLSYTKVALYEELLASDLPDDPHLAGELERYFPTAAPAALPARAWRAIRCAARSSPRR